MKIDLSKIKLHYSNEISQAKANNYEAVIVPLEYDFDIYCLNNIDDEDYIFQIAEDCGWDRFILIDFINNNEKLINLFELEAA
ncbi:MAG: hypothetical protein WBF48_12650 [Halarcobacter sp.]